MNKIFCYYCEKEIKALPLDVLFYWENKDFGNPICNECAENSEKFDSKKICRSKTISEIIKEMENKEKEPKMDKKRLKCHKCGTVINQKFGVLFIKKSEKWNPTCENCFLNKKKERIGMEKYFK